MDQLIKPKRVTSASDCEFELCLTELLLFLCSYRAY